MFKKLTRTDLAGYAPTTVPAEYVDFLSSLRKGEGGAVKVAAAGVSRQTVKNRINKAADSLGYGVKFRRSGQDEVVFEVLEKK